MGPHRYYDDEEPPFRRYSARGNGYPLSHDRDLPPAPHHISYDSRRVHHSSLHDTRNSENSSDQDSNTRPRSRIPVACGRCRKRKIRCSGDNGGPCSNCKSAGNDQCQFLRVSSQEAPLKIDTSVPDFFDPGTAASRMQCRMVPQGPQYLTTHSPSSTGYDSYQYRSNSLSTYQEYPGKQYYSSVPTFTEYDENVDYGLQTSPYQLMGSDNLQNPAPNSNYGTSGPVRGWTPAPHLSKSNTLFIEQEQPLYTHGQLPYGAAGSFPLRTTIGPESKGIGLAGMPTLPAPITGNDRVLPNPATNRPGQIGSFLRNNDGLIPMTQPSYQSYGNYMTASMLNNVKAANHNAVSENSYSIPISSTGSESSQIYTGSENNVSLSQHQNEMYSPTAGLHYHSSEHSSESSYGHTGSSSRRESQSSRTTNNESSLPSLAEGDLSNGQHYIPYHNSSSSYPTPPMNIPPPAPIHPRASIQPVQ